MHAEVSQINGALVGYPVWLEYVVIVKLERLRKFISRLVDRLGTLQRQIPSQEFPMGPCYVHLFDSGGVFYGY